NNGGEGNNSTGMYSGVLSSNTPFTDLTPSGVDLHSGHPLRAHMNYDGTTLTVIVSDTVTGKSATQSYTVNIPSVLGG
ncbi:hypothetical protein ABTF01_22465, partial [Acinetobacter baumannii]